MAKGSGVTDPNDPNYDPTADPYKAANDAPNPETVFNPESFSPNPPPATNGGDMNAYQEQPGGQPSQPFDPTWNVAPTPAEDPGGPHGSELAPPVPDGTGVGGNGVIDPPAAPVTTPADPNAVPANGDLGPMIAQKLAGLFNQAPTADINDPALASERLTSQRNFENQRALLAERAGVEGTGNSGGFDSQLLGLGADRGAADLAAVGQQGQTKQQQIMDALRLASQNQSGNNQLGLSYAQLETLLNSQALQSLLAGTGA